MFSGGDFDEEGQVETAEAVVSTAVVTFILFLVARSVARWRSAKSTFWHVYCVELVKNCRKRTRFVTPDPWLVAWSICFLFDFLTIDSQWMSQLLCRIVLISCMISSDACSYIMWLKERQCVRLLSVGWLVIGLRRGKSFQVPYLRIMNKNVSVCAC